MTRNHRRWHYRLWLILGPLLVAGLIAGVLTRPAPGDEPLPAGIPRVPAPHEQEKAP
jgi:hypothetical protein